MKKKCFGLSQEQKLRCFNRVHGGSHERTRKIIAHGKERLLTISTRVENVLTHQMTTIKKMVWMRQFLEIYNPHVKMNAQAGCFAGHGSMVSGRILLPGKQMVSQGTVCKEEWWHGNKEGTISVFGQIIVLRMTGGGILWDQW